MLFTTALLKTEDILVLAKLTYWQGTHTQSAGTTNWTLGTVGKTVPRSLPSAINVASVLAAQTFQFEKPCTNLTCCSFPGKQIAKVSTN